MAISIRGSAGAWVASTGATQTVTLPTHQTGDMLIVRAVRKPFTSPDSITCDTAGWNPVGTGVANGSTASGNGTGSMAFKAFYKVAESASETNPVVTWGVTPTPGACSPVVYQLGAGEGWVTPTGTGGGDATARTSQTSTMSSHISVTAGDMVDFFRAQCDDSGALTVPTITQTGVTFGTVSEQPATAGLFADSNDLATDGGYRLATAGTSSAAAVITGTSAASEQHGAWMTRLRVTASSPGNATGDLQTIASSQFAPTVTGKGQGTDAMLTLASSIFAPTLTGAGQVTAGLLGAAATQLAASAGGKAEVSASLLSVPSSVLDGVATGKAEGTATLLVTASSLFDAQAQVPATVSADLVSAAFSVLPASAGVSATVNAGLLTMAISQFVASQGGAAAVSADLQTFAATLLDPTASGQGNVALGMLEAASGVFDAVATGRGNVSPEMLTAAATVLAVAVTGAGNTVADLQTIGASVLAPTLTGEAHVEPAIINATFSLFTHSASGGGGEAVANADTINLVAQVLAPTISGGAVVAAPLLGAGYGQLAASAAGSAGASAGLLLLSAILNDSAANGRAYTLAEITELTSEIFDATITGSGQGDAVLQSLTIEVLPATAEGDPSATDIEGYSYQEVFAEASQAMETSISFKTRLGPSILGHQEDRRGS